MLRGQGTSGSHMQLFPMGEIEKSEVHFFPKRIFFGDCNELLRPRALNLDRAGNSLPFNTKTTGEEAIYAQMDGKRTHFCSTYRWGYPQASLYPNKS